MNKYLIAGGVTLLVAFGLYRWGYHEGWGTRDAEMQAEIAKKNEEARQVEQHLTEQITTNATKLQEANHALDQKQSDLDRAIRAGRVRLFSASCVPASPDSPASARNRDEARSEPDREADAAADAERQTLLLIAQIAADGDRAINQLNACIDSYNEVRKQLNGDR